MSILAHAKWHIQNSAFKRCHQGSIFFNIDDFLSFSSHVCLCLVVFGWGFLKEVQSYIDTVVKFGYFILQKFCIPHWLNWRRCMLILDWSMHRHIAFYWTAIILFYCDTPSAFFMVVLIELHFFAREWSWFPCKWCTCQHSVLNPPTHPSWQDNQQLVTPTASSCKLYSQKISVDQSQRLQKKLTFNGLCGLVHHTLNMNNNDSKN